MKEPRIEVDIIGIPRGQPRTKARAYQPKNGGAMRAMVYTPDTAAAWRGAINVALYPYLRTFVTVTGPVEVSVTFRFPRPARLQTRKSWMHDNVPHTGKPDADNLLKALFDEITTLDKTNGCGLWKDDAQVWRALVSKRYVNTGESSGAHVKIWF